MIYPIDVSSFIETSIFNVVETLFMAIGLVILVIFIFLQNFRATFIPAIAIPIVLLGTFGVIFILGYSINVLTLFALVLAIGMLVDDAIVVLENIYRHMEMGKNRVKAAYDATSEIGFTVISITLVIVVVFVPIALSSGTVSYTHLTLPTNREV